MLVPSRMGMRIKTQVGELYRISLSDGSYRCIYVQRKLGLDIDMGSRPTLTLENQLKPRMEFLAGLKMRTCCVCPTLSNTECHNELQHCRQVQIPNRIARSKLLVDSNVVISGHWVYWVPTSDHWVSFNWYLAWFRPQDVVIWRWLSYQRVTS